MMCLQQVVLYLYHDAITSSTMRIEFERMAADDETTHQEKIQLYSTMEEIVIAVLVAYVIESWTKRTTIFVFITGKDTLKRMNEMNE